MFSGMHSSLKLSETGKESYFEKVSPNDFEVIGTILNHFLRLYLANELY